MVTGIMTIYIHLFFLMMASHPDKVYIAVDFPYGDKQIPYESAVFAAKMWYMLDKYTGIYVQFYSDNNEADPKFSKFYLDFNNEYKRLKELAPIDDTYILPLPPPEKPQELLRAQVDALSERLEEVLA
jgi:hypothetical protein